MLIIKEIYPSIQGESTHAGLPCVFVRLTGCNLRCTYCDTEYAFSGGQKRSIPEIVEEVKSHRIPLVELTGGEPLLQADTPKLAQALLESGYKVLIETSGERDVSQLDARVIKIMDLKCPSSGECDRNRWENIAHLNPQDEVKFVIGNREDFDWAKNILRKELCNFSGTILFSPVFSRLAEKGLANWILQEHLPVRLQIQMHKYIWDPLERGV